MTTEPNPTTRPIYLMLRMKPPWVFIDEIRRFVESFCACACPQENREAQLALAVHELMQNAIACSHEEDVELTLEVDPAADKATVTVSNHANEAEYQVLRDRIDRMNHEPDALKHYLKAMSETPMATRGGLGLARVRFESQLELSVVRSGGRMSVFASGPLRAPALQLSRGVE